METRRPMEDFFCNPTHYSFIAMDDEHLPRMSMASDMDSNSYSPPMPPHDMFSFKVGQKTPEPAATIRTLVDEPLFWRGYTSEEEVASPADTDDMSFRSASSRHGRASQESFPEQLAQSCARVERQCSRAQAVTLVSAGKAKVVSMPKLVDIPATPRIKRPAPITPVRSPVSRLNRLELATPSSDARTASSSRPSFDRSFTSNAPSSLANWLTRGKSVRQRPSLPNLQATARSQVGTPVSAPGVCLPSADFLEHDPYPTLSPTDDQPTTPAPMSPSRRRLHKISSSFSLNKFGKGMKRSNSADHSITEEPESETMKEPEPKLVQPLAEDARPPTRSKMIPRGANERAPPLVLPPCPEGYENERDLTTGRFRQDLGGVPNLAMKLHKRQRSMSAAALVSAQA